MQGRASSLLKKEVIMHRSWKAKGSARMAGDDGFGGVKGVLLCSNEVVCNNGKPIHKKPERPG